MSAPDLSFIRHRPRRRTGGPTGRPDLGFIRHRPRRPRAAATPPAPSASAPAATRPPAPTPPPPTPPARQPPLNPRSDQGTPAHPTSPEPGARQRLTGRTVLTASSPSVTIGGSQASTGALHLTLGWSNQPTDPRSVRAGIKRSTDVHLGCLWEMTDEESGVVQSLGGGSDHAPGHGSTVLRLGPRSETRGETLTVALSQVRRLKRLVLFVYAYSRTPEWGPLGPVLVAELKGATVEMRVDRASDVIDPAEPLGSVCVLASLHRVGDELVLRREAEMLYGQQSSVAEAFGWDLAWADGRTVPPPRTVR